MAPFRRSNARTFGPPPLSTPVIRSATPSAFTFPHWGFFYLLGSVMLIGVLAARAWPTAAPLMYGSLMSVGLFYWAARIRRRFGRAAVQ